MSLMDVESARAAEPGYSSGSRSLPLRAGEDASRQPFASFQAVSDKRALSKCDFLRLSRLFSAEPPSQPRSPLSGAPPRSARHRFELRVDLCLRRRLKRSRLTKEFPPAATMKHVLQSLPRELMSHFSHRTSRFETSSPGESAAGGVSARGEKRHIRVVSRSAATAGLSGPNR